MANPTLEPAGTAEPKAKSKPSLFQALKDTFTKSEEADESKAIARRRKFVMAAVLGTLTVNLLMFLRFFFPRALYEPKSQFKIGYPSDFGFGVDTKFQKEYRIWVVRNTEGIFVISAICTHLGCTPDWKPSENKF
jgi:cytochrome b6-f complex iron-sulfur subunit